MHVYFVESGKNGPIKIGMTTSYDVNTRISQLQTGNPEEIRLIKFVLHSPIEEKAIHKMFEHIRIRGEWFQRNKQLLTFIELLKDGQPPISENLDLIDDRLLDFDQFRKKHYNILIKYLGKSRLISLDGGAYICKADLDGEIYDTAKYDYEIEARFDCFRKIVEYELNKI